MLPHNSRFDNEQQQRFKYLLITTTIIVFIGFVYYIFVSLTGFGIPCFIRALTGIECPGCGVTRMLIALIRLDFKASFGFNPVVFCALPFLAICFGAQAVKFIKTGKNDLALWQNIIIWMISAALLIFGIIRNL